MRSAVVLPQPDGPTSTRNSPSWMSSDRLEDGLDAVVVDLVDVVERDVSHWLAILQMWNAGPSAGSTPSRASSP